VARHRSLLPLRSRDGARHWSAGAERRRRAEKERKRAEERFQFAVEAAPVAIILLDRQGRISLVNPQVERLFGYQREELLGQVVEVLIPERFRQQHPDLRESFFTKPGARAMGAGRDLFGLRKDGTEFPVEVGLSPIHTDVGLLVLATIIDITDRKRAEEQLRVSHEQQRDLVSRLFRAQEVERRRLAREMHDDLTQRLAVMAIDIGKLEEQLNLPVSVAELLRGTRDQLVKLSEDVHALSRQLHPSILEDLGLTRALRSECVLFQQREGIAVIYQTDNVPASLPRDTALCLYRIAQEALRNVARHAATSSVEVSLIGYDGDVLLTVSDAGKGFDVEGGRSQRGLGLASMEERARLIGAELSIHSHPDKGTTITVLVLQREKES
jgi:PAS domain S-box-containing protein